MAVDVAIREGRTFTSADETDVTFNSLTAPNAKRSAYLAVSLRAEYRAGSTGMEQRGWRCLVIGSDVQYGDDGLLWYDCLYAVSDITGDGLDDVAVRCRNRCSPTLRNRPSASRVTRRCSTQQREGGLRRRSSQRLGVLIFGSGYACATNRTVCYAVNLVDSAIGKSAVG